MTVMKKVGILYHPMKEAAEPLAQKLEKFLTAKGVSAWVCSAWETEAARAKLNGTDLILSVGGDGTILRAAQIALPEPIPITGINLGNLGFMTELNVDEAQTKLAAILAGEGWLDERALLEAELSPTAGGGKPFDTTQGKPGKFSALNDVVVARGEIVRLIYVESNINGTPLATYKADGVIVATATGSTGYSLSAGGPVLNPQAEEMVMLPIMPHLSLAYPLVLPPTAVIKLVLKSTYPATLSIDGHINLPLSNGAIITVRRSSNTIRFLRIYPPDSFYGSLERRLKGKQ
ncbi:MAG: NAD(+)/NADH kinase [Chloroflexi bacterium]|nr:NAD(+)/NADH kinase [Chloroflexota bacterium]